MTLLEAKNVHQTFTQHKHTVVTINKITISIKQKNTLGLIDESKSDKSTLGRIILNLLQSENGNVSFDNASLNELPAKQLHQMRSRLQMVFQKPFESLNPQMTISQIVTKPLKLHHPELSAQQHQSKIKTMFEQIKLDPTLMTQRPQKLNNGQQQRIGIAQTMITHPNVMILDKPTSSLDLSVRARILNLLTDLRESLDLTYLFISHDISTIRVFCSRIAMMYQNRIVKKKPTKTILNTPLHPYTQSLLSTELSINPFEQHEYLPLKPGRVKKQTAPGRYRLLGHCPTKLPSCTSAHVNLQPVQNEHQITCIRAKSKSAPDVSAK